MGGCTSNPTLAETKHSRAIDDMIDKDHEKDKTRIKLLLLGAGESGKSTIFKQMRILYGKGYAVEDRKNFKPVIYSNTVLSMKTLVQQSDELGFAVSASVRAWGSSASCWTRSRAPTATATALNAG